MRQASYDGWINVMYCYRDEKKKKRLFLSSFFVVVVAVMEERGKSTKQRFRRDDELNG